MAASSPRPETFDAFSRETIEDPYAFYRAMREHAPVFKPKGSDWWYVNRYADVKAVARDTETYSSQIVAILLNEGRGRLMRVPKLPFFPVDVLAIADPPDHGRHRKLSTAGLGRGFPRDEEAWMNERVESLLDRGLSKARFDWMGELAFVLPMQVALRLLDLDTSDYEVLKLRSDEAINLLSGTTSSWGMARDMLGAFRLYRFCAGAFRRSRKRGATGLMGALVAAVEEGKLSETEASSIVLQLIIAGSDSSASLMGSAVALLARDLELQDQLLAQPELLANFVEEAIRLEAPFQGHFRQTTKATSLAGTELPAGARLFLNWASANRDEQQYERADQVDLERPKPRAHMSFGHGIHLCIGAALGRMEARLSLTQLLARTKRFTLADAQLVHRPSVFVRTLEELNLNVELA